MKPLSRLLVVGLLGFLGLGGTLGVGCVAGDGADSERVASTAGALVATDVLGFEIPAGWTVTQGTGVTLTQSTQHVQGSFSLGVTSPRGFTVLTSARLASTDITLNSPIGFQLLQPVQQVNPFFLGAVQLFVEVPSLNVFNQFLGQVDLTGKPKGVFQRVQFTIPAALLARLRGASFTDLVFRIALNVPVGNAGTYLLDAFDGARAVDAGADAGAADANDGAADANPAPFPGQVVAALCARQAQCCAQAQNSGFDVNACAANPNNSFGWHVSNAGSEFIDGGNVVLDPARASACLADIQAIGCGANGLTSAMSTALYADCYGALKGKLDAGAPCHDAIECSPGQFCPLPTDGGTVGACSALRAAGQPCGDFGVLEDVNGPTTAGFIQALSACSYRASGTPAASCVTNTLDNVGDLLPESQWVCHQAGPVGAFCTTDLDCTSLVCDDFATFTCVTSVTFFDQTSCTPLDAGAD